MKKIPIVFILLTIFFSFAVVSFVQAETVADKREKASHYFEGQPPLTEPEMEIYYQYLISGLDKKIIEDAGWGYNGNYMRFSFIYFKILDILVLLDKPEAHAKLAAWPNRPESMIPKPEEIEIVKKYYNLIHDYF